jgi:hypothetical protein
MNEDSGHIPMAITPTLLKLLPTWVAAVVRDYATGDPQQHWRLRDGAFIPPTEYPFRYEETERSIRDQALLTVEADSIDSYRDGH